MSLKLAIVTCGPQLEVALASPQMRAPSIVRLAGVSPRSTLLLAAVDLLLEDTGLEPDAVEAISVSRGPGSFTGIRAGLATAAGLAEATGAVVTTHDSLLMNAARHKPSMSSASGTPRDRAVTVWTAQPGRRGQVYARRYEIQPEMPPRPMGEIEIVNIADISDIGGSDERDLWIAPEALDLGRAVRATCLLSAAEALLRLDSLGAASQPLEPLYVEGPPVHGGPVHGGPVDGGPVDGGPG